MTRVSGPDLEIERVFLLERPPELPPGAEAIEIEQGYLPDDEAGDGPFAEGRLRRKRYPDGRVACVHTIKRGEGMVREEQERAIDEAELEAAWPRTAGRRIRKTRHRVDDGGRTWEVDVFRDMDLAMAEVELDSAEAEVELPAWLAPVVRREVTDDPRYRNYELARRGPPEERS